MLLSLPSSSTPSLSSSSSLSTGEAFDKAARLLGLRGKSSGGVAIEQQAELYRNNMHNGSVSNNMPISSGLTIPMRDKPNCDFSYAGTQLLRQCIIVVIIIISSVALPLSPSFPFSSLSSSFTIFVLLPPRIEELISYRCTSSP